MAAATVAVAHRMGNDVPGDLTVVGFDDTPIATTIWPELTTVRQPMGGMAHSAVRRALGDLRDDITRVTGAAPVLQGSAAADDTAQGDVLVAGTLGRSRLIDDLAARGRIHAAALRGTWEGLLIQTVADPWPGVPVRRRPALFMPMGRVHHDAPVVRYRGSFINDEVPALPGWAQRSMAASRTRTTHTYYARVCELMLRLRAKLLWPAMWSRSFFTDDPRNAELAHERGFVMSTSHHEPMQRAHRGWGRPESQEPWDYRRNAERLRGFWDGGIERMRGRESLGTIGMRGGGDMGMDGHGDVALLDRIVLDQRAVIEQVTGLPAEGTPQVWAFDKEVQANLGRGMRLPDDVLMLFADDNWGNIRRLPTAQERQRPRGSGVYCHFANLGGQGSYKGLNVTPIL